MEPTGRRIALAVNPTASFGSREGAGSEAARLLTEAGHHVTVLRGRDLDELRALSLEILAPDARGDVALDAYVVVGGDGMVHLAAGLLAEGAVPLGILPSGTGNDMARGLGVPLDDMASAVALLDAALRAGPRRIDLGRATGADGVRWFGGAFSAGFDAIVNERANAMRWPRGPRRYTLAIARELLALRPRAYTLVVDGVPRTVRSVLISVSNNTSIGGGMLITPDARVDDGLLDLFVVAPIGRLAFLRVFPKVFSGTHTGLREVAIERVSSVRIDAPGIVAYADGERIGELPQLVEVVPGALLVLTP